MSFTVELETVTKRYGEYTALQRFSEHINAGDRISIIGHNGAGKSTLLNIIAGLTKPNEGNIHYRLHGRPLVEKVLIRSHMSYLSHEPMMYPDLTSLENLQFTARLYGGETSREALMPLLETVGMEHAADRLFRTCSRGMQQRMSLARALLPKPALLLLDEPFSGLDTEGVSRMKSCFQDLDSGWVMVTHHLELGWQTADRFWVMGRSRLLHSVRKEDISFDSYLRLCGATHLGVKA